jgi:hypothetical protein
MNGTSSAMTRRASQGAAHHPEDLANEPVILVIEDESIHRNDRLEVTRGLEQPQAELELVRPQAQNGVVPAHAPSAVATNLPPPSGARSDSVRLRTGPRTVIVAVRAAR